MTSRGAIPTFAPENRDAFTMVRKSRKQRTCLRFCGAVIPVGVSYVADWRSSRLHEGAEGICLTCARERLAHTIDWAAYDAANPEG